MTMMKKGLAGVLLMAVLAVGTVAAANSQRGAQQAETAQVRTGYAEAARVGTVPATDMTAAPAESAKPARAPSDRRAGGATLSITDLASDVADEKEARVNVRATGVLKNTGKSSLDVRDARVWLKDSTGKVAIPARIEVVGGQTETLEKGQETHVRLTFANVPVDAGALQISMDGGAVENSITITIRCSYPPLKCTITISF